MKSSLSAFRKGLADLRIYMEGLDLETKLPSIDKKNEELAPWEIHYKLFCDHYHANRAIKKRYNYNSVIISMYGLVEQYIEALMHNYLELLQKIVPSYPDIPESIVSNHVAASFELIKYTEQNRYKGTNTKELIISKLNSCLSDPQNYKLNSEAFCHHTANFRSDVINVFFQKVGFSNIMHDALGNKTFNKLLEEMELNKLHDRFERSASARTKENKESGLQERAFYFINDLADRRNEVAHGVSSQLLAHDILLSYVYFLEPFGETIYDVLFQNLLWKEVNCHGMRVGKPTDVYKGGSVFCVWSNKAHIKKGDYIVGQNASELVIDKILEMQVDGIDVDEVSSERSIEIGVRTNCKFKKSHRMSILEETKEILL